MSGDEGSPDPTVIISPVNYTKADHAKYRANQAYAKSSTLSKMMQLATGMDEYNHTVQQGKAREHHFDQLLSDLQEEVKNGTLTPEGKQLLAHCVLYHKSKRISSEEFHEGVSKLANAHDFCQSFEEQLAEVPEDYIMLIHREICPLSDIYYDIPEVQALEALQQQCQRPLGAAFAGVAGVFSRPAALVAIGLPLHSSRPSKLRNLLTGLSLGEGPCEVFNASFIEYLKATGQLDKWVEAALAPIKEEAENELRKVGVDEVQPSLADLAQAQQRAEQVLKIAQKIEQREKLAQLANLVGSSGRAFVGCAQVLLKVHGRLTPEDEHVLGCALGSYLAIESVLKAAANPNPFTIANAISHVGQLVSSFFSLGERSPLPWWRQLLTDIQEMKSLLRNIICQLSKISDQLTCVQTSIILSTKFLARGLTQEKAIRLHNTMSMLQHLKMRQVDPMSSEKWAECLISLVTSMELACFVEFDPNATESTSHVLTILQSEASIYDCFSLIPEIFSRCGVILSKQTGKDPVLVGMHLVIFGRFSSSSFPSLNKEMMSMGQQVLESMREILLPENLKAIGKAGESCESLLASAVVQSYKSLDEDFSPGKFQCYNSCKTLKSCFGRVDARCQIVVNRWFEGRRGFWFYKFSANGKPSLFRHIELRCSGCGSQFYWSPNFFGFSEKSKCGTGPHLMFITEISKTVEVHVVDGRVYFFLENGNLGILLSEYQSERQAKRRSGTDVVAGIMRQNLQVLQKCAFFMYAVYAIRMVSSYSPEESVSMATPMPRFFDLLCGMIADGCSDSGLGQQVRSLFRFDSHRNYHERPLFLELCLKGLPSDDDDDGDDDESSSSSRGPHSNESADAVGEPHSKEPPDTVGSAFPEPHSNEPTDCIGVNPNSLSEGNVLVDNLRQHMLDLAVSPLDCIIHVDLHSFDGTIRTIQLRQDATVAELISRGMLAFNWTSGFLWFGTDMTDRPHSEISLWELGIRHRFSLLFTSSQTARENYEWSRFPHYDRVVVDLKIALVFLASNSASINLSSSSSSSSSESSSSTSSSDSQ